MVKARSSWVRWGRALWILFALNSIYVFSLTFWIMLQVLRTPSARLTEGLAADSMAFGFYKAFFLITIPSLFLTYFTVALLIYVRRPNDSYALFAAIFLVNFGTATAYPEFAEFLQFYLSPPVWYGIPARLSILSSWTLLVAFLVLYPDGQFVPRWSWVLAAIGFLLTATWGLFPDAFIASTNLPGLIGAVSAVVVTGACLYVQFWRYRHHFTLMKRQQAKWFVFALAIFLVSTFVYFFASIQSPALQTPAESIRNDLVATATGALGSVVIPIAVGIAILRYRLWDIDVIIRRTLVYGALTASLGLVYFGSVVLLQGLFEAVSGQRSAVAVVISTLLIAALFNPLRRRIQNDIDRHFFRQKYDAEVVVAAFGASLREEVDLEDLQAQIVAVVQETLQPEQVSLWLVPAEDKKRGMGL